MPYRGINVFVVWAAALEQGFNSSIWMTFRQALELNTHVCKGEKGSLVVYADSIRKTEQNDAGAEVEREIHFLKGYTVFNVEQIEGLAKQYYVQPKPRLAPRQRLEHAEAFFAAIHADIRYRGDRAYYAPEADYIQLPFIESFCDPVSFFATLAHECCHNAAARIMPGASWPL